MTPPKLSPRHAALLRHVLASGVPVAPSALEQALQVSRPTINRDLRDLLAAGLLDKQGDGRSTRYLATAAAKAALGALPLRSCGAVPRRQIGQPVGHIDSLDRLEPVPDRARRDHQRYKYKCHVRYKHGTDADGKRRDDG